MLKIFKLRWSLSFHMMMGSRLVFCNIVISLTPVWGRWNVGMHVGRWCITASLLWSLMSCLHTSTFRKFKGMVWFLSIQLEGKLSETSTVKEIKAGNYWFCKFKLSLIMKHALMNDCPFNLVPSVSSGVVHNSYTEVTKSKNKLNNEK